MRRLLCAMLALALCLSGAALSEALLDQFEMVSKLSDDRYLVRRDGLWGLADASGALLMEPRLTEPPEFEGGYAVVSELSDTVTRDISGVQEPVTLYGLMDETGELCIPLQYDSLEFSEGIALVREGEDYLYLQPDGAPLNGERYYRAEPFTGDCAAVGVRIETAVAGSDPYDALWGLIDRTGAQRIPCQYELLEPGTGGPVLVGQDKGDNNYDLAYGYVDMSGQTVIEPVYDSAQPFVDGLAAVCQRVASGEDFSDSESFTSAWGVIDATGREVLPLEYDYITVHDGAQIEAQRSSDTVWYAVRDGEAVEIPAP